MTRAMSEEDVAVAEARMVNGNDSFLNENDSEPISNETRDNKRSKDGVLPESTSTKQNNRLRQVLLGTTCLYIFFYTGAFYGWGPMQLMLEDSGHFSSQCAGGEEDLPCPKQSSILLNVQFVACLMMILSPLMGAAIDKFGTSTVMNITFFVGALGLVFLTISTSLRIDWMLFPTFLLIGFMSVVTGLFTVQTGLLYPEGKSRDRVISGLNALLDAGGMTYLVLWFVVENTEFSLPAISGLYLGLYVLIMGVATFCWIQVHKLRMWQEPLNVVDDSFDDEAMKQPKHEDMTMTGTTIEVADEYAENEGNLAVSASGDDPCDTCEVGGQSECTTRNDTAIDPKKSYTIIAMRPPSKQLMSKQFLALAGFFAFHQSHNTWILTTTKDFLSFLGDDEYGNKYLSIFTLLTPVSILGLPFVDIILRKYGYSIGLHFINLLGIAVGLVKVTSTNLSVQVVGFVMYSFYRCFVFSITFSCLPTFLGIDVLGKGCGFLILYGGILSFIVNIPLSNVTMNRLGRDFFLANLLYLIGCLPCVALCEIVRKGFAVEKAAKQS
mmetsp:Transcript_24579/g.49646  ORF Transcript_24579/g.49646 Transcript_24579/m.49646 type:complete len:552 (+) Transcript_24579:75-1730(+)